MQATPPKAPASSKRALALAELEALHGETQQPQPTKSTSSVYGSQVEDPEAYYRKLPSKYTKGLKQPSEGANFVEGYVNRLLHQPSSTPVPSKLANKAILLENTRADASIRRERARSTAVRTALRQMMSARQERTRTRAAGFTKATEITGRYVDFLMLHRLWTSYMDTLLKDCPQGQMAGRISKADYHGCILSVVHSKCKNVEGLSGIVLKNTRHTFKVISEDDKVRVFPKRDAVFLFEHNQKRVTVHGNKLLHRK